MLDICPCGSDMLFSECCEPYILQRKLPSSPEALMRSRFSAYVKKAYAYIVNTYTVASKQNLTVANIAEASKDTTWIKLEVMSAYEQDEHGEVEFIAFYKVGHRFYAMHELSRFIKEDKRWRYVNGDMLGKTGNINLGRNDTCLCGSGKKYKHCCAA